jgi:predicted amidohydrolase
MPLVRALAAAQTVPARGDVSTNIAQHVRLARVAADAGAEVVVFPELSLTGYEMELAPSLAFSENDTRLAPLMETARATQLTLIVGAPLRLAAETSSHAEARVSDLHIAAFILYPDGTHAIHTKRHLGEFAANVSEHSVVPPAERTVFTAGNACPLVRLAGHTAAVSICAESLQRWAPKDAAERGARSYLTSHFALPSDREQRIVALGKYAAHYDLAVVFACFAGATGGLPASGGSAILSPTGALLVQLEAHGQGVAIACEDADGWSSQAFML